MAPPFEINWTVATGAAAGVGAVAVLGVVEVVVFDADAVERLSEPVPVGWNFIGATFSVVAVGVAFAGGVEAVFVGIVT